MRQRKFFQSGSAKLIFVGIVLAGLTLSCAELDISIEPNHPTPPADSQSTPSDSATPAQPRPTLTGTAAAQILDHLSPEGPWLVFVTGDGSNTAAVWAANPDGSALTPLTDKAFIGGYRGNYLLPQISPNGQYLAYIEVTEGPMQAFLQIIDLATGVDKRTVNLYDSTYLGDSQEILDVLLYQASSLAWSPDGNTLAFIGAMEGGIANLYLHEPAESTVSQARQSGVEAYMPVWSADGSTVLYTSTRLFHEGEGFSPFMFAPEGLWALDGGTFNISDVPWPYGDQPAYIQYAPWYGSAYIFFGQGAPCETENGCWLDVRTGERGDFPFSFVEYAISPENNTLLAIYFNTTMPTDAAGTYLFTPQNPTGSQIGTFELDNLQWLPGAGVFTGQVTTVPALQSVQIAPDGTVERTLEWGGMPDYIEMAASPDGEQTAWYRFVDQYEVGLWLGQNRTQTLTQVSASKVHDALWTPDSQQLYFTIDDFNALPEDGTQGLYLVDKDGTNFQHLFPMPAENFIHLLGFAGQP